MLGIMMLAFHEQRRKDDTKPHYSHDTRLFRKRVEQSCQCHTYLVVHNLLHADYVPGTRRASKRVPGVMYKLRLHSK